MVTWLDLTAEIASIEGLVAPPPGMEVFDLDGIKIVPPSDHADNSAIEKTQEDADSQGPRYVAGGESAYDNMSLFTAWRKEQEKTVSIGTPPPANFVPPRRRKLRPTSKKFNFTPEQAGGMEYKSDEMDGAVPHAEDGKVDDVSTWEVPGQRLGGVTVWAGSYLHGLQFHAISGACSPRWGKCGGEPAKMWTVNFQGGGEGDSCVGLKFFLGDTRGPYRLQETKIVGVQRLVSIAARFAKHVVK
ncbi:MAG: hypothetical protein Q9182_004190 [Xanthomendoza sp. 2 TL-2023]